MAAAQKGSGQKASGQKPPTPKQQEENNAKAKAQAEAKSEAMSKEQQQKEAQDAAVRAQEAKKMADYYASAAAGAGDPDERQDLINKKLDQEMRAETFGKTAKWIQSSGSFQGFAAGSGLGIGLGATLGTLTGTLVGGPTGLITGGIGAGIGYMTGPFVNVAEWGGNKLRSITGDLPGWKATAEQKKALEHMCGQISNTEAPTPEELDGIAGGNGWGDTAAEASMGLSNAKATGKSWKKSATDMMSSKKEDPKAGGQQKPKSQNEGTGSSPNTKQSTNGKQTPSQESKPTANVKQGSGQAPKETKPAQAAEGSQSGPRKLGKPSSGPTTRSASKKASDQAVKRDSASPATETKKKPRKLEPKSTGTSQAGAKGTGAQKQAPSPSAPKRTPKKLETRS